MFELLKKNKIQEINTLDDLKVTLEKYLNIESIKQSNINEPLANSIPTK